MKYQVDKLVRPGQWDMVGLVDDLRLALTIIQAYAEEDGGQYVLRCVEEEQ